VSVGKCRAGNEATGSCLTHDPTVDTRVFVRVSSFQLVNRIAGKNYPRITQDRTKSTHQPGGKAFPKITRYGKKTGVTLPTIDQRLASSY
jgi:hypothetical protein